MLQNNTIIKLKNERLKTHTLLHFRACDKKHLFSYFLTTMTTFYIDIFPKKHFRITHKRKKKADDLQWLCQLDFRNDKSTLTI